MRLPMIRQWALGLAVGLGTALYSTSVVAAEKVVLKYSIIRLTIPVSELETFAETGQMSPALDSLLGKAKKNPDQVRRALMQPIKVRQKFLDQALNSKPGEILLDQVGEVIHTPSGAADRQALRAALVLSASNDDQMTLLEVIKNYPTPEVDVEGDRLVEAYGKIAALGAQLGNATERLQDLLNRIRLPKL